MGHRQRSYVLTEFVRGAGHDHFDAVGRKASREHEIDDRLRVRHEQGGRHGDEALGDHEKRVLATAQGQASESTRPHGVRRGRGPVEDLLGSHRQVRGEVALGEEPPSLFGRLGTWHFTVPEVFDQVPCQRGRG